MAVIESFVRNKFKFRENNLLRDSAGNLYIISTDASGGVNDDAIWCHYSTDGGVSWTDVLLADTAQDTASAIASDDVIHVVYENTTGTNYPYHVTFSNFTWGTPEVINSTYVVSDDIKVAIDSQDNPHVVWSINKWISKKIGSCSVNNLSRRSPRTCVCN